MPCEGVRDVKDLCVSLYEQHGNRKDVVFGCFGSQGRTRENPPHVLASWGRTSAPRPPLLLDFSSRLRVGSSVAGSLHLCDVLMY